MKPPIFAAIPFGAILLIPLAARAADPLAVKFVQASNDSSTDSIHFVLDGDETCDAKAGRDCVFSSDCSEPVSHICVSSKVEIGRHRIEAFANGQHLVAWANVKTVSSAAPKGGVAQCVVQEDDGGLILTCF